MKLAVQTLFAFCAYIKYIVLVPIVIFAFLFSIWFINIGISSYISNHNSELLGKYKFQETEQSIIMTKLNVGELHLMGDRNYWPYTLIL
jgi:hypothetical protein